MSQAKLQASLSPALDVLPPNSAEAEQGVLGCCLLNPKECLPDAAVKLSADSFYDLRHQMIYEVMQAMQDENKGIDLITLIEQLKLHGKLDQVGGFSYLNLLQDATPSAANLSEYLEIVEEKCLLRRLIQTCTSVRVKAQNCEEKADSLRGELEGAVAALDGGTDRVLDAKALIRSSITDIERRAGLCQAGKRSGLETGWYDLDRLTDGLQFGEQCIVGARPSMGKTAIACNLIENICFKNSVPSAFITLEMSPDSLVRRFMASWCRIDMSTMRAGSMSEPEMQKMFTFQGMLRKAPLHIVDGVAGMNERQVCSELRRLKRRHGIKFAVIDYLQKCRGSKKEEKKTYEVGSVSSAFKAVAKELDIALVTLAQLNRENEKDKGRAPRLSDLGDSKQLEQDGDLIALLHRPRSNDETIDSNLIIAKQRDGELGVVHLTLIGRYCRFESQSKASE